jgi:hypothetical protein
MPALTNPAIVNIKGEFWSEVYQKPFLGQEPMKLRPEMTGVFFEFTKKSTWLVPNALESFVTASRRAIPPKPCRLLWPKKYPSLAEKYSTYRTILTF